MLSPRAEELKRDIELGEGCPSRLNDLGGILLGEMADQEISEVEYEDLCDYLEEVRDATRALVHG